MILFRLPSRLIFVALFLLLVTIAGDTACARTGDHDTASHVRIGFNGQSRLGAWFPVFVKANDGDSMASYLIDTVDADGFPVTIQGRPIRHADGWWECVMQAGRKHGECRVRLLSEDDHTITHTFRLNDSSAQRMIHPSTQGLTVVIEPGESIASTVATQSSSSRSAEAATVSISDSNYLPSNWLAWQAVQRLIISASATEQLQAISSKQWLAIKTWVERGGDLVVSVGPKHAKPILEGGPLAAFVPGNYLGKAEVESSSRIEFFANADEQLIARDGEPIEVCRLEAVQGRVELNQDSLDLIVTSAYGFGESTFVGFDLSDMRFTQWKGFSGLLQRIESGVDSNDLATSRSSSSSQGNRVSHVGYTDLVGQLRLTLDRFPSVTFVSFASIAVFDWTVYPLRRARRLLSAEQTCGANGIYLVHVPHDFTAILWSRRAAGENTSVLPLSS